MDVDEDNRGDENPKETVALPVDQEPPDQPVLGSVTTFSNAEGSDSKVQQIRSSARVSKKLKLDLTVPQVAEKTEKKEEVKTEKKCFRPLWSSEDKNIFFEALCEYGKDFENILVYISNKLRKKGVSDQVIKTKDQVRHLYYRTWSKISKHLKFSEGVKKVVQELYGLINYGELRKKIGSVNEKALHKLNEMVYTGSTMIRFKGKSIRIKTPMCKALRHLNQMDEKYDEVKLPNRITVELQPKDMLTFLKVQSMAQNPRLRATLPLQKRLSCLIDYLSNKWKTVEARTFEKALISPNAVTNTCLPPEKVIEATTNFLNPSLRLTPPQNCRIEIPSINICEYLTRQNICLSDYESRLGIPSKYSGSNLNFGKNSSKKNSRPRTGSVSEKSEKSPHKNTVVKEEDMEACDKVCDTTEADVISDDKVNDVKLENIETEETYKSQTAKMEVLENEMKEKQKRIDDIRLGWTKDNCESLTVGELYLMFGTDSRLILEYSWDSPKKESKTEEEVGAEVQQSADNDSDVNVMNLDVSYSLSQLLSIAKLHYRKNIIKCACGHVCGSKNDVQLKRAVQSKIMKMFTNMDKCADDGDEKMHTEDTIFDSGQFVKPTVYMKPKLHPISPSPFYQSNNLTSQISSIQRLKPRYCNRRGRKPRSKQVVVERKLPLLPNNIESGHQIVRMNIISPEDSQNALISIKEETEETTVLEPTNLFQASDPVFLQESPVQSVVINEDTLVLMNENTVLSTTPPSPTGILKENDHEWIESEVADYSLSSLLGHLESPIKGEGSSSNMGAEDSRMSHDVDAQLRSLLTESSLDFSAKFADLAEQVTNDIKNSTQ